MDLESFGGCLADGSCLIDRWKAIIKGIIKDLAVSNLHTARMQQVDKSRATAWLRCACTQIRSAVGRRSHQRCTQCWPGLARGQDPRANAYTQ